MRRFAEGTEVAVEKSRAEIESLLTGIDLWVLKTNLGGAPAHPLYLSYDLEPVRWLV